MRSCGSRNRYHLIFLLDFNFRCSTVPLQVMATNDSLSEGAFVDPDQMATPDVVRGKLTEVKTKLESFETLGKQYANMQELFGEEVYVFKDLKTTLANHAQLDKLWTTFAVWEEKHAEWMSSDFKQMSAEEVNKEVMVFFKDAFGMNKKIDNEITATLLEKISEMKQLMPPILELGNPNMRERHWEKIFKALNKVTPTFNELKISIKQTHAR
jgi:hypothetical protein